jgi:hypothetical protein
VRFAIGDTQLAPSSPRQIAGFAWAPITPGAGGRCTSSKISCCSTVIWPRHAVASSRERTRREGRLYRTPRLIRLPRDHFGAIFGVDCCQDFGWPIRLVHSTQVINRDCISARGAVREINREGLENSRRDFPTYETSRRHMCGWGVAQANAPVGAGGACRICH